MHSGRILFALILMATMALIGLYKIPQTDDYGYRRYKGTVKEVATIERETLLYWGPVTFVDIAVGTKTVGATDWDFSEPPKKGDCIRLWVKPDENGKLILGKHQPIERCA